MNVTVQLALESTSPYQRYLRGDHWRATRAAALERAGHVCERCHHASAFEVHHLTYVRLGHERPEDLQAVCRPCHAFVHGVPVGRGL